MIQETTEYEPLSVDSLGSRLGSVSAVAGRVGGDPASWDVQEVGDGNLNLVFVIAGPEGKVVVKQALPYVRLVGDSWPLPLNRSFFEYHALIRQAKRDPGSVPEIYHFDETQALIVMEFLDDHVILRYKLIAGEKVAGLAAWLGKFVARTAFRGSDLAMDIAERKSETQMFLGNVELCKITEALVFTDPYFAAPMNHHTSALDPLVAELRSDVPFKTEVQRLLAKFVGNAETLLHGDLHTGSVMCTHDRVRVIDPEFGTYGPMGFDLGMLIANFLMALFSQPGHREPKDLLSYQEWITGVMVDLVDSFEKEFSLLWQSERRGLLYSSSIYEDQGHTATQALAGKLAEIWEDALGFCGIEMNRRILSLAQNADFEKIANEEVRAKLEARNLMLGRYLVLRRADIKNVAALAALANEYNQKDFL